MLSNPFSGAKLLEENLEWGALVIGLTFLPFLYVFAETFLYWILIKGICEGIFRQKASVLAPRGYKFTAKDLIFCFYEFPGVRATRSAFLISSFIINTIFIILRRSCFRNAWILVNHQLVLKKLEARQEDSKRNNNEIPPEEAPMMQSSRPEDDEENIRSEMRNASMSEFILESYPQAGFQIYLMGVLNFTSKYIPESAIFFLLGIILELEHKFSFFLYPISFCFQVPLRLCPFWPALPQPWLSSLTWFQIRSAMTMLFSWAFNFFGMHLFSCWF